MRGSEITLTHSIFHEVNNSIHDDVCAGTACYYYWQCRKNYGYCPKMIIRKAIKWRDEREQYIINLHCGFYDRKQYSFAEIGRRLGITGTRVSQIYKEAVVYRKYKAYYGIPKTIISYGGSSTVYARFYNDIFKREKYDTLEICGKHIPSRLLSYAFEKEAEDVIISKLQLSITNWDISEKLRRQLVSNDVTNIADIFSLPFHTLFFDILHFDYHLLVELKLSLQKVIPIIDTYHLSDINDDEKKQDIKLCIKQYIEKHGLFISDYSTFDTEILVPLKAERLRTADLISELWYTDSLPLLNAYEFDFMAYWKNTYQAGFNDYGESDLLDVVRKHYFPSSVKKIAEQTPEMCIRKLDIDEFFGSHVWNYLRRDGIDTIGDLLDYPEDKYDTSRGVLIPRVRKFIESVKNII